MADLAWVGRRAGSRVLEGDAARSARAWIWAVRGAWPLAAAAAARSGAVAAVAGCPASSCAWAWRHRAYPALCGLPSLSQAFAAAAPCCVRRLIVLAAASVSGLDGALPGEVVMFAGPVAGLPAV